MKTLLQRTIQDKEVNLYPVWLMRQAGRYMPEYMAMKEKSNGFLDTVSYTHLTLPTNREV